jgi:ABC-type uncharacterized transport system substrate-binding protein
MVVSFALKSNKPLTLAGEIDFRVCDPPFYTVIDVLTDDKLVVESVARSVCAPSSGQRPGSHFKQPENPPQRHCHRMTLS